MKTGIAISIFLGVIILKPLPAKSGKGAVLDIDSLEELNSALMNAAITGQRSKANRLQKQLFSRYPVGSTIKLDTHCMADLNFNWEEQYYFSRIYCKAGEKYKQTNAFVIYQAVPEQVEDFIGKKTYGQITFKLGEHPNFSNGFRFDVYYNLIGELLKFQPNSANRDEIEF